MSSSPYRPGNLGTLLPAFAPAPDRDVTLDPQFEVAWGEWAEDTFDPDEPYGDRAPETAEIEQAAAA